MAEAFVANVTSEVLILGVFASMLSETVLVIAALPANVAYERGILQGSKFSTST